MTYMVYIALPYHSFVLARWLIRPRAWKRVFAVRFLLGCEVFRLDVCERWKRKLFQWELTEVGHFNWPSRCG
jgi:hypothetical protein